MKKIVLTYGLISGLMISVLMDGSLLLASKIGSGHNSMALGYTIMVASFLLIYFGVRSYRDGALGGQVSFGRALACGILISLVTTACYVVSWEVLYFNFMPHFMDSYFAAQIHRVQSSGLDPAMAAAQVAAIQRSQQLYQNPFVNMAYTFMEPLPVGLVIAFLSAGMLRRKAPAEQRANFHYQMSAVQKDEVLGVLLALFLGSFGLHHFYLKQNGLGILYLFFFWTGIPGFLGFIEAFFMPSRVRRYNAEQAAYVAAGLGPAQGNATAG